MTEALFYEKLQNGSVHCALCPLGCVINGGGVGKCGVRRNIDGTLYAKAYGQVSGMALDPVTKKPLNRFHPDGTILSIGSYGCNFKCLFCQNHAISMSKPECTYVPPDEIAALAEKYKPSGNIGVAYTYNEPFINFEYVFDCARAVKERGMLNVLVTNGFVSPDAFTDLAPYIDAMNIDLKTYSDVFYADINGDLDCVKQTIRTAAGACHVEVTTLVISGKNDSDGEMASIAGFIASIDKNIPLHINRFTPRYKMADADPTPRESIERLADVAKNYLNFIYKGNI